MSLTAGAIYSVAGLGAGAVSLALTPAVARLARSAGWVDAPGVRKVHQRPVPRVGGLAIGVAVLVAAAAACWAGVGRGASGGWSGVLAVLVGAVPVLVVGFLDDVLDLRSTYKLLALLGVAVGFCAAGGNVASVVVHGRAVLDLGVGSWPLTMLGIVTVTVAVNFIDGLDGLAAGIVAVAAVVLGVGAAAGGYWPGAAIAFALAGGLGGFLAFNSRPASIFMGDGGSLFIGFTLAATAALCNGHVGTTRAVLLPAMALAVPLLDTAVTMLRRGVLQRRSLFAAERGHIHHKLMDAGLCHGHAVLALYAVTLGGGLAAMVAIFVGGGWAVGAAVAFGIGLAVLFRAAGSVRSREVLAAVRRNRMLRRESSRYQHAFYDMQLRFRSARTADDWWRQLCRAAEVLDVAAVDLPLSRRDGTPYVRRWRRRASDEGMSPAGGAGTVPDEAITAEVPVPQRRTGATVRARLELLPSAFLETGGLRVALFARLMGEFGLDRLPTTADRTAAFTTDGSVPDTADVAGAFAGLRVAVVHDVLTAAGGDADEGVLGQLLAVVPHAELFALVDARPRGQGRLDDRPVHTSFVQRLPMAARRHLDLYLPLLPIAAELLDVSGYDLVISSSRLAAKGVITRPDQLHVCYCHGHPDHAVVGRSLATRLVRQYVRKWDARSALGVDLFLTDTRAAARRIAKVYRRTAAVVDPAATDAFRAAVAGHMGDAWAAFKAGHPAADGTREPLAGGDADPVHRPRPTLALAV